MKRFGVPLLVLPLVFATNLACAQDGIQNVAFFYPLRTRRPVIERELEVRVEHAKGRDGRTTEAAAAALPWPRMTWTRLRRTPPRFCSAHARADPLWHCTHSANSDPRRRRSA